MPIHPYITSFTWALVPKSKEQTMPIVEIRTTIFNKDREAVEGPTYSLVNFRRYGWSLQEGPANVQFTKGTPQVLFVGYRGNEFPEVIRDSMMILLGQFSTWPGAPLLRDYRQAKCDDQFGFWMAIEELIQESIAHHTKED